MELMIWAQEAAKGLAIFGSLAIVGMTLKIIFGG